MKEIKMIIEEIQSTNSRIDKERILTENKSNGLLKDVLNFIVNPYILTGLNTKKINKKVNCTITKEIEDIYTMMNYLQNNNTGTDQVIVNVQYFLNIHEDKDFYKSIFTKSLKLGCDAKTLNKVFGDNFIPTFDVMLAQKYFDNEDYVNGRGFTLTIKRDGNRAVILKDNGNIKIFTRQGQLYFGLVDLENELLKLDIDNVAIDGELMVLNDSEIPSDVQFKETMKVVRKDGEKHGVKLVVFDYLPISDFKNGICNIPYITRRDSLEDVFKNCTYFEPVEKLYQGKDINEIHKYLDIITSHGGEGIMININNAPYECKRVKTLLKVKKMQSADLKIIGFEQGEGRLKHTLGKINVEYKGNSIGVGSGFSDSDRTFIWEHQEELYRKIAEIKYFEESTNQKDDKLSLRFPIFKALRLDKTEPSYF